MPLSISGGLETSHGSDSSDGQDQSKLKSGHQLQGLPSLILSTRYPITLTFVDVSYGVKVKKNKQSMFSTLKQKILCHGQRGSSTTSTATNQEKTILNGVTGIVSPGEILAVLGPSGSGKSTLLNALAGRLHSHGLTGTILVNNQKLSKSVTKKVGFVSQDDVLYPHLTVRETLIFCSLLRLPKTLKKDEKVRIAESIINELGLKKCENTIIGNNFIRGVSGGERKRVSIGHEMLINPSLLILDEPTSGLDSTAAFKLVMMLAGLTRKGKTIVLSMHQPSSRVYQMVGKVALLSEGRIMYFGKGCDALNYFDSIGFVPSFPVNPADFLLDLANGHVSQVNGMSARDKPNIKQYLIASYNTMLAPKVKAACMEARTTNRTKDTGSVTNRDRDISSTTWFNQFCILFHRSLKERRHEAFNTLRTLQVITAAILAGLMWWHSNYHDVQDRLGLLFFMSIFWGVLPSFNAVLVFPQERAIFVKERASGMYTLSSYFLSRIVGEMPMELILPTIFLTLTYWTAGLKPDLGAYFLTLLVLLGYVLVSQGLGLAIGTIIMDAKQASTMVTIVMLAFVLTGGYYVHKVPPCQAWMKYVSTTFYTYRLLINVQYGEGTRILSLLGCSHDDYSNIGSCKFVEQDIVRQIRPEMSVGIMVLMFVGYRIIAYLALRSIRA